ncbi:MAG: hypothetical protein JO227_22890 [Acetobacteraceae bacterium]|nr:hypothetical protein [Acetobacteraceae bacterium]
MKIRRLVAAAVFGTLLGVISQPIEAAEVVTLEATSGRLLHSGLYPAYYVFLDGVDPATTRANWIDKPYKAVLDIKEGPEKGESVVLELVPTSAASPNPEWCDTEGGDQFSGGGVTCKPASMSKDQLRIRVRVLRADDLPKTFGDRKVAEYPNLPGRRENEILGPLRLQVLTSD